MTRDELAASIIGTMGVLIDNPQWPIAPATVESMKRTIADWRATFPTNSVDKNPAAKMVQPCVTDDGVNENGCPLLWNVASCNKQRDEVQANLLLIAAAPDLLKACRQALYELKGREHDQFLRNAIFKATGIEP